MIHEVHRDIIHEIHQPVIHESHVVVMQEEHPGPSVISEEMAPIVVTAQYEPEDEIV